jgi:hypothetical protein
MYRATILALPLLAACAQVHAGATISPAVEAELEGRAVAILCQEYDALAVEFPQASLEDLLCKQRNKLVQRFAKEQIPPTVGVLGRLESTHERYDGPLFADAVARHGLEEQCRGFPLLRERRALELVCDTDAVEATGAQPVPFDELEREGLSNEPVIGALAAASTARRPLIFTEAVQRYDLTERCEGSTLYRP